MCTTQTIAAAVVAAYYNGDVNAYYEDIADGEIHQCTAQMGDCDSCERILRCSCEEVIPIKKVTKTQKTVYQMWHLLTMMSLSGRAKYQFLENFDAEYVEHPIHTMLTQKN